jgi:MFS family permease
VRTGGLIAFVMAARADRRGRRRLLLASATLGCLFTMTGALAPNLAMLGLSQTVARGMSGALVLLITILSAEEMPPGTRAYAYSLITMTGALGAGMCVWALPLADVGDRGWRLLYVLPVVFLPLIWRVGRQLPESRRFAVPHTEAPMAGHGGRFWLLASSLFLLAVFAAPASQVTNDFLRVERGFSASRITLYIIATSTPGAIGIVIGGRLADVRGRRVVGAVGITGGTILTVITFLSHGWPLWAWSVAGSILAAMTVPVIGVYRPELFPTSLRGKAAGLIEVITLSGSAFGLWFTGRLADRWGSYAGPIAILAIPSLVVAVLMLVAFPETAKQSLEDLNPEDVAPPVNAASP